MTLMTAENDVVTGIAREGVEHAIRDNAWLHFTQMSAYQDPGAAAAGARQRARTRPSGTSTATPISISSPASTP